MIKLKFSDNNENNADNDEEVQNLTQKEEPKAESEV